MPNFVVVTAFKSKDQMSADMKKMGMSAKNFGKIAGVSFRKATTSALSFKKVIGGILGAAILRRGFGALAQGVRTVAEEFIDFDASITAASAKFGVFDRESETFKDLAKTAREVGAITEFTAPQAAEGLRFLAKAGWTAGQSMKALPSFVDLATASEMEFSRAADIATDVLGAFGLAVKDPTKRLENLTMVNDVMAQAVNMSNIDMEDLFETLKYAAPIASKAGVSIQKLGAMAAYMGGAGVKGSMGGTALRTMFLNLAAPTDDVRNKLKKWGISLRDSKKNMRDPIKILQQLTEKFKTMGNTEQIAMAKLMFGKHAVTGAAISLEGASGALQEFETRLNAAGGSSKKMSDFMRTSLENRLEALKSGAIELGFKVLDAFGKKFPESIDDAIAAVRKFDVKPIVDGIRTVVSGIQEAIKFFREYGGVLKALALAIVTLKLTNFVSGLAGAVLQMGLLRTATGGVATGLGNVASKGALALSNIGAVMGALGVGLTVGTAIYEGAIKPAGKRKEQQLDASEEKSFLARTQTAKTGSFGEMSAALKEQKAQAAKLNEMVRTEQYSTLETLGDLAALATGGESAKQHHLRLAADATRAANSLRASMQAKAYSELTSGPQDEFGIQTPAGDFAASPKSDSGLAASQAAQAKAQRVDFQGQLNIAGAPPGSTVSSKTKGAPPIKTALMGANP